MTRTGRIGARSLAVGFVVVAIAAGSATAAASTFRIDVHARLAPVAGAKTAGRFSGVLTPKLAPHHIAPGAKVAVLPGSTWQLAWRLYLPKLAGPMTATLRVGPARKSHVLCTGCSTKASGDLNLSARQVRSISKADAVVVVRTRSAMLRGPLKVLLQPPVTTKS